MTTVQARVREIFDREGFDIIVKSNRTGKPVKVRKNGVLGTYPFRRKASGNATVADWRRDRFEATYPGFTCDVLKEDGKLAHGRTSLQTVRDDY